MTDEKLSQEELIQRLTARVDALEKKLEEKESKKDKKDKKKSTTKKVLNESERLLSSMVDASTEALKEGADAITSLSDETDKEKLGTIPAAFMSIIRKTIDIQKKALDKFEESYDKYEDEEDDDD